MILKQADRPKKIPKRLGRIQQILLTVLLLMALVGCSTETAEDNPLDSAVERALVPAASDDLRVYSYDPASIKYVEEKEGKERIQVFIRVDYPKSTGSIVAENQIWEVRLNQLSYKVVASAALDASGDLCPT